jgi:hypothetical protein
VPRQAPEGIEYQSRCSLADRPVVAVRPLLSGVGVEPRGWLIGNVQSVNRGVGLGRKRANVPKPEDKPFAIPRSMVWEAWRRVKANEGAPGVDGQDLVRVRGRSCGRPLQGLESDEFGDLVPAPGQGGGDP